MFQSQKQRTSQIGNNVITQITPKSKSTKDSGTNLLTIKKLNPKNPNKKQSSILLKQKHIIQKKNLTEITLKNEELASNNLFNNSSSYYRKHESNKQLQKINCT